MKQKIGFGLGMLAILIMVYCSPWGNEVKPSGLTSVMRQWGEQQEETSDKFTTSVVSGAEGSIVGEHEIDGSNWAIPNIIRHWLGVD